MMQHPSRAKLKIGRFSTSTGCLLLAKSLRAGVPRMCCLARANLSYTGPENSDNTNTVVRWPVEKCSSPVLWVLKVLN